MSTPSLEELMEMGDNLLDVLNRLALSGSPTEGNLGETLQELLRRADEARKNKHWDKADVLCRKGIQFTGEKPWTEYRSSNMESTFAKAVALIYLGTNYLAQFMPDGAIDCFQRAGDIFHDTNRRRSAATARMALGQVYELRTDWDNAIKAYQQCLNEFGDPGILDVQSAAVRNDVCKRLRGAIEQLSGPEDASELPPRILAVKPIPVKGEIAAGSAIQIYERNPDEFIGIDDDHAGSPTYALRVCGNSMKKAGILDNDYVFIRKQDAVYDGEIAAIRITNKEDYATLKRFFRETNHWRLQPENDDEKVIIIVPSSTQEASVRGYYKDKGVNIEVVSPTDMVIEGKVVGILRRIR